MNKVSGVNLSYLTPPTLSVTGWWGFLLEPRETTSRPSPGRVEKVVPIESQNVTNRTENWVLWIQGWQLISDLTFCDSCANWVAALWRFGAEAPSPHPDALRSCWLFWMLLTQQLIESIIQNNLCWSIDVGDLLLMHRDGWKGRCYGPAPGCASRCPCPWWGRRAQKKSLGSAVGPQFQASGGLPRLFPPW